jgi:hypothetical protein
MRIGLDKLFNADALIMDKWASKFISNFTSLKVITKDEIIKYVGR